MALSLGSTTYTSVTWTTGDVITEAKLDNMVANDQAYDSHAAQGILLNNTRPIMGKDSGGTNQIIAGIDSDDYLYIGDTDLNGTYIREPKNVWWEEMGRTTLGSNGDTISVTGMTAKKYLRILISVIATGGNIAPAMTFNGDTGNNYNHRTSDNGGADATSTSRANIGTVDAVSATTIFIEFDVINISAQEKIVIGHSVRQNTAGAGNAVARREVVGKWANTAAQITRVDVTNADTGDFASGSEVVVLGHD